MNRPVSPRRAHTVRPWAARLTLAAATLGLVVVAAAMWNLDLARLAPPPADPAGWSHWWSSRDPLDAAAGLARIAVLAAAAWLAFACSLHLLATMSGSRRLSGLTARLLPRALSGLTAVAVAGTLHVAPVAAEGGAVPAPAPGQGATMELVDDGSTAAATPDSVDRVTAPPVAAVSTPTAGANASVSTSPVRPGRGGPASHSNPSSQATVASVIVRPGDHLWGIAEGRVALAAGIQDGRRVDDDEVAAYWRALVELNRDRLVDPEDPDLILPGQELVLPA